jgi:transmembrane 9 superfamily protein 2/4
MLPPVVLVSVSFFSFTFFASVFIGTGVQLCCMVVATLSFALLGLLSPANRGSLITAFILLFVFMGSFAGYHSSMIYKMFRGIEWKQNTLFTAFLYPGIIFSILFVLNLLLWIEGSSGAIPFSALFTLLFLWFCVSVPLVFLGSFFGYKREMTTFPVRTNQIPRTIPPQAWYMNPFLTCLIGGILPFGAVSVELYFIMSALWLHQIYYIFGFLFLVAAVLLVTCAEISILLCYFQLCNEDYHWWWRSFLHSGACAGYTALYAVWYHLTELEFHGFVPMILYYGYMTIICFSFFIVTGTIGYYSCFWFNSKIYASIKVD